MRGKKYYASDAGKEVLCIPKNIKKAPEKSGAFLISI
jgi:hypothetical protein